MNECPPLSVPSVNASLKESSDMESDCTKNLRDKQHLLVMAREEAVKQVYRHQRMIVSLDEEIDNVGRDLVNVHVHYSKERETLLHKFVGSLLREKKKENGIPVAQPTNMDLPPIVVPRFTPSVKRFLPHDLGKFGSSSCGLFASECREFMGLSNAERLKVFFKQCRCYGCFLSVVVAGHSKLRDCKHLRQMGPLSPTVLPSSGRAVGGKDF
ncbi:hypothetical protein OUZ56_033417 [Daphnia magna]|uniref:Uncharacterized protein n=1 Tax=Daphnia magna TaxID=35525 RepID=A0ABQ9ZY26_9CRUS|nr:hypothetical protein OUZ56_033417 [Daphnia magna]